MVKDRKFKYILFFWFLISAQFVIGNNLQTKGYSIKSIQELIICILKTVLYTVIFVISHYLILNLIRKTRGIKKDKYKDNCQQDKNENGIVKVNAMVKKTTDFRHYNWGVYFLIIVICWIPTILAFYPIIFNYDGPEQIAAFLSGVVGTRQPMLHTLLITGFYKIGYMYLGSSDIGMLLLSIFQMSVMSAIFSYAVKFVEDKTNKRWLRNVCLIFYAVFPINSLFSIMTTKDVLFAGFYLLFIINLYKIYEGKYSKYDYICIILLSTLMLLFRNNAVYALIVLIPFVILILRKNKNKLIDMIISILLILLLNQAFFHFLMYKTDAILDSNQEKMSIFSQAVAKVCKEKGDELSRDEKIKISYFFSDYRDLGEVYISYISDPTKKKLRTGNIHNNKMIFYELILQLGNKYPRIFLDSFLNTSRGYWYILDQSFNKIGNSEFPNSMGYLELPFNENSAGDCKVNGYSFLPQLRDFYKSLFCYNNYTNIPILFIVFQPATYFYIVVAFLLYAIYKRDKINMVIGMYLFLYFVTCFLGPVAIVRYIYAVIVSVPVIISNIVSVNKKEEKSE